MTRRSLLYGSLGPLIASRALKGFSPGDRNDEEFWLEIRRQFPIDPNVIQLNNAAIGSSPRSVLESVRRYADMLASQPSHAYYDEQDDYVERVRQQLAAFFGCDAEELAVTRNASEGLANVIFGLDLKPGDEVLTTTQDYPAVLDCLRQRAARQGIAVKTLRLTLPPPSEEYLASAFERGITDRTRLIVVSHMTYATGQIFPVKRICQLAAARNIQTLIDGAQSFGQIPFQRDDLGCDYFATSLHKYFCAPLGTGFLYIRRDHIDRVWPLMGAAERLRANIRKFDGLGPGTMPIELRNAIPEAIYFHTLLPVEQKAERLRYLRGRWTEALREIPEVRILTPDSPAMSCGTALLVPGRCNVPRFVQVLEREFQIQVRLREIPGEFTGARVSPNVFTTSNEIDRFVDGARTLIRRGEAL